MTPKLEKFIAKQRPKAEREIEAARKKLAAPDLDPLIRQMLEQIIASHEELLAKFDADYGPDEPL
jgi:hypothetical protein